METSSDVSVMHTFTNPDLLGIMKFRFSNSRVTPTMKVIKLTLNEKVRYGTMQDHTFHKAIQCRSMKIANYLYSF